MQEDKFVKQIDTEDAMNSRTVRRVGCAVSQKAKGKYMFSGVLFCVCLNHFIKKIVLGLTQIILEFYKKGDIASGLHC
jgi:hypothetical protein